jgi:hypothetical protein
MIVMTRTRRNQEDIDTIMVVDSGADEHLTRDEEILTTLKHSKTCIPNLRATNGTRQRLVR